MISYRFFCLALIVMFGFVAGKPAYAQLPLTHFPVDILENGTLYTVMVPGNHRHCTECNHCGHYLTSKKRPFEHFHVAISLPTVGTIEGTTITKRVTQDNVRALWDAYYTGEVSSGRRANVIGFGGYYDEKPTYNCWSYSFGDNFLGYERYSSIWINNPENIYDDDYSPTNNPVTGNVIRLPGHVLTVASTDCNRFPPMVITTAEKFRHSRIYYFLYWEPDGCILKDYLKKK